MVRVTFVNIEIVSWMNSDIYLKNIRRLLICFILFNRKINTFEYIK